MPEGHTIHRIARDHQPDFAGRSLRVESPQGRFAAGAEQLDRRRLLEVEACGKHLFYHWSRGLILHVHLGLYGKFRSYQTPLPEPRGQVRLRVASRERGFDLHGPNACELIDPSVYETIVARLGPDPLRRDSKAQDFVDRVRRSRAAIGSLLLNQSVIAGVGNVYRAELLHLQQIHPERPGNELDGEQLWKLWQLATRLMRLGVKHNRIITADPRRIGRPRSRMKRGERLCIYKKDFCPRCGQGVSRWELAGRTMYACDGCQA